MILSTTVLAVFTASFIEGTATRTLTPNTILVLVLLLPVVNTYDTRILHAAPPYYPTLHHGHKVYLPERKWLASKSKFRRAPPTPTCASCTTAKFGQRRIDIGEFVEKTTQNRSQCQIISPRNISTGTTSIPSERRITATVTLTRRFCGKKGSFTAAKRLSFSSALD